MKTSKAVVGKWPSILPMLGVSPDYLTGKHTACPICENGKDKFRFDDKGGNGTFFCNDCGAGGGWKLLELIHGWEFKTAAKEVDRVIGNAKTSVINKTNDTEKRRAKLNALRKRVVPYDQSDKVIEYLKNRGIDIKTISTITHHLGFIPDLEYWEDGKLKGRYAAMTGLLINGAQPSTYHMTFLEDGVKANLSTSRKIMPPVTPIVGGAVRLFEYDVTLGIAEGIETALAATQLFKIPTWAALNANNLKSFAVPNTVTALHIFGDNDPSFTGQKAAYELGWRAVRKGLTVQVHIPPKSNEDWNDVLVKNMYMKGKQA